MWSFRTATTIFSRKQVVSDLAYASDGGMFVLFTSHAALRKAAQTVIDGWDARGIEVVALPSLDAMDSLRAALGEPRP